MINETISSSMFDGMAAVDTGVATPNPQSAPQFIPQEPAIQNTEIPLSPAPQEPVATYNPREIFGEEYDSFDKVKEQMTRLQTELNDWQKREPDFANEDLRYKNYALKAGFTESQADVLKGVISGELSDPKDVVAAKLQIQYGWDKNRVENYMNRTYKLGDLYDEEDSETLAARDNLDMQSAIDKQFLLSEASKIQVPQAFDPNQAISQQLEEWKPVLPQMLSTNSTLKLADGIDYKVPAETMTQAEKHVMDVLQYDRFDLKSEEVRKGIQEVINKEIVYREFNNIVNYLSVEHEKKAIRDKSNVPSPSGEKPNANTSEIDNLRHIISQMG